ncbi:polyprenyl synthetase family protein [Catenulispora pinisilvae]|uniref:polyprenyl synthetase family protein n=1 Tax=Catenulispora pinisilvae TaxID=2705253 RepID=UPI0018923861|nr:polyprenyl synthetase family protein [Catenulispora pinisilvae]
MVRAAHPARTVAGILAEARGLTHSAHVSAVDRLPGLLRRIAGYHLGWWEPDGSPLADGDGTGSGGGKALRPALTLACAAAVSGPGSCPDGRPDAGTEVDGAAVPAVVLAAVAVELIHDFSLLQDDVMDGDSIRRGRPAAWKVFGAAQALLTGDALLAVALALVSGRAQAVLADAVVEMCEGQSSDLLCGPESGRSPLRQLAISGQKTGALFGAACELGALAAGAPDTAWCRAFGTSLGIAFQIADDLADGWAEPGISLGWGRGEAHLKAAIALSHLDAAALEPAATRDLRLLASAVPDGLDRPRRGADAPSPLEHPQKEIGS